jgi:hypothetical protein
MSKEVFKNKLKVRFIGKGSAMTVTHGEVYEVLAIEDDSYRIIDDTDEDYLYPMSAFQIIPDGTKAIFDQVTIITGTVEDDQPEIEVIEVPVVKSMVFQFNKPVKLEFS